MYPGKDDVFLLHLSPKRRMQVDKDVFDALDEGASLRKDAWSHRLESNGREIERGWSRDFRGMLAAMPALIAILLATILWQRKALSAGLAR